jgi:hypothetical protein
LALRHRELSSDGVGVNTTVTLGTERWRPEPEADALARSLRSVLSRAPVLDLILFGSQARGGTTGFSDVDAILVIDDASAEDPAALRALRRHVLAAQRSVVGHQPMQHHGFEVATPKLLHRANRALAMPVAALRDTRSLMGTAFEATFEPDLPAENRARLAALISNTSGVSAWPANAWRLHGLVSMFELLPALYLQARGSSVAKWRSFSEARSDFGDGWWPYDLLEQVRACWPRESMYGRLAGRQVLRNPWIAVAAWSRMPLGMPAAVRRMLSEESLDALRAIARQMRDRAC